MRLLAHKKECGLMDLLIKCRIAEIRRGKEQKKTVEPLNSRELKKV
jgi:hypothetical protein